MLDLTADLMAGLDFGDGDAGMPLDLSEFDFSDTPDVPLPGPATMQELDGKAPKTEAPPPDFQSKPAANEGAAQPYDETTAPQPAPAPSTDEDTMPNRMLPPEISASLSAAQKSKGPREIDGRLDRAAIQGEPFEGRLVEPTGLAVEVAEGLAETGLAFDPDAGAFHGVPTVSGTVKAVLVGTLGGQPARVNVRVPVSPDPWSLWKDLPVPDDLAFQKPDQAQQRVVGDLVLLLASQRGRSHAHKALPRDDDGAVFHDPTTGWHVGTVADGAGSAPLSREGSRVAVQAVIETLPELLSGIDVAPKGDDLVPAATVDALYFAMMGAARAAAGAIDAAANDAGEARAAFSTTLIMGAAKRVEDTWILVSFSVGDGLVGVYGPGLDNPLMMSSDSGDYAGQTVFLTTKVLQDPSTSDRLVIQVTDRMTAFAMMTDGVSDPMFASDQAMDDPAAWDAFWTEQMAPLDLNPEDPGAAKRLLYWLSFKKRGEHDDRTIVLMLPRDGTADGAGG